MTELVNCENCDAEVPADTLNVDNHCIDCQEAFDEEERTCYSCRGTGIPQHGPPDVGRCSTCGGSGEIVPEQDYDDYEPDEPDYDLDYLADKAAEAYENSRINDNY
jgi:hypothetical protein